MATLKNNEILFGAGGVSSSFKANRLVNEDFNNIVAQGMYCAYVNTSDKHAPWDGWSCIIVFNIDDIYIKQIAFEGSGTKISWRTRDSSTWGNWTALHT